MNGREGGRGEAGQPRGKGKRLPAAATMALHESPASDPDNGATAARSHQVWPLFSESPFGVRDSLRVKQAPNTPPCFRGGGWQSPGKGDWREMLICEGALPLERLPGTAVACPGLHGDRATVLALERDMDHHCPTPKGNQRELAVLPFDPSSPLSSDFPAVAVSARITRKVCGLLLTACSKRSYSDNGSITFDNIIKR